MALGCDPLIQHLGGYVVNHLQQSRPPPHPVSWPLFEAAQHKGPRGGSQVSLGKQARSSSCYTAQDGCLPPKGHSAFLLKGVGAEAAPLCSENRSSPGST